ncbi:hypothetical protein Bca52824_087040 [Brassica carinata]|uniref:Uncharacterized protein n=1 Tax=Brassica carinata TaxID=52824 RepID=A0A8X7TMK0_BRACI|nr:hypothetical protein Bca52824_087040 [Brassica carinata]
MFSIWILVDDNPRSEPLSDHVRSLVCRLCGGTVDWPSFSRPRLLDALGVLLTVYQELIPRLGPLPISWLGLKVMNRQGKPCFCNGGGAETSDRRAGVVMDPSVREALDHLVFHYEARVDEGGPANADHSSLERLPADLQAAKDHLAHKFQVSTDLYAALEAEWDAVLARVKCLEEYISRFVTPHEVWMRLSIQTDLWRVSAQYTVYVLRHVGGQGGEVEIETEMVVLSDIEKECDSAWRGIQVSNVSLGKLAPPSVL